MMGGREALGTYHHVPAAAGAHSTGPLAGYRRVYATATETD